MLKNYFYALLNAGFGVSRPKSETTGCSQSPSARLRQDFVAAGQGQRERSPGTPTSKPVPSASVKLGNQHQRPGGAETSGRAPTNPSTGRRSACSEPAVGPQSELDETFTLDGNAMQTVQINVSGWAEFGHLPLTKGWSNGYSCVNRRHRVAKFKVH